MRSSPFLLLCTTGFFALFSSTISKSPVLPLYAAYLGANPSEVGFVASLSSFTGIIASIPAGILSDRFGRKNMLLISLFIFASAPFLYPLANNLIHLALIRFYHGFATALFVPVAMALVADLFKKERGEKLGWFSSSTLAGRFLAPLIGGALIGYFASNSGFNYKIVYLLCGLCGVTALLIFFLINNKESSSSQQTRNWHETWVSFKGILTNRLIIITSTVEAAILFAYGTFETFIPLYCIQKNIGIYEVGIILSVQVITIAITKPAMGKFSDRHGREPQIFIGSIAGTCSIASFAFTDSFIVFLLLSIAFGLSLSVVTSATSAFISDLCSRQSQGSAMGMLGSIMDIGHTTGPIVSGFIATLINYEGAFIGAAIVLALSGAIFQWTKSKPLKS